MNAPAAVTPPYKHTPLFPLGADTAPYRKLTADGVRSERVGGHDLVVVEREALRALAEAAFTDINHLLRPGRLKFTDGDDEAALAEGARDAYLKRNLRYSQLAPISMFEEKNTKSNMPAQVEIYAEGRGENDGAYKLLFIAKGGGSANKSFLFQATPAILTHDRMLAFLKEKVLTLGTAACPPYHLAIVIGGTSAELTMK